ncbi:hypothetical protein B0A50_01732 [Salinomyces thailandicus]|uniref:Yeast cell wall synthesis Kre9/Knh1-like N-terminal domain-containing protein n=1 Tax=Salinomyces thailandicus TaxID=706561 RepID=A0A4U0UBL7_9PEZI|nr:hypothetical protein B0A50_01732 [Salinomyces thailandica]
MSSTKSSPRDFSLFSLFAAGLACLAPFANAYTQPVGAEPMDNPISMPGLGSPYTITWEPTTSGTVTLVLLKGPSSNAVPQYAIVEEIDNDGSYVWTPSTDLAPGQTGYGIQLIVDATGQYQYTTQFGISNPDYNADMMVSSSSSVAAASTSTISAISTAIITVSPSSSVAAIAAPTNATMASESVVYTTEVVSDYTTYCPYATSFTLADKTYTVSSATTLTISDCSCTVSKPVSTYATSTAAPVTTVATTSSPVVLATTGGMPANGSIVYGTGAMSVPSSLKTTASAGMPGSSAGASGSGVAPFQGAASSNVVASFAGVMVAAGVAVFAL